MEVYDAAVIGGGMAGIGCVQTLLARGASVTLIATLLGGSVYSDGQTNLGAYLLTPSAAQLAPFLRSRRLVWLGNTMLWTNEGQTPLYRRAFSSSFFSLYRRLKRFRRAFVGFQRAATIDGQLTALQHNPYLQHLTTLPAYALPCSPGERQILRAAVDPVVRMCALAEMDILSAFEYLHIAMHLDVPVHTFRVDGDMLHTLLSRHRIEDFVLSVRRSGKIWELQTGKHGLLFARTIVVATGSHAPCIEGLSELSVTQSAKATLWHVRGVVSAKYPERLHVFPNGHPMFFVHAQGDGTVIAATRDADSALQPYLIVEEVLRIRTWEKAFPIGVRRWHSQDCGDGLYKIDDYNVVGMEDAYRSGIWAANAILRRRA